MRLDPVHLSMLVIGVSFACYSPSLNSLQDQAYKSAVVIEGKVQSAVPANVSSSSSSSGSLAEEPHSVHSVRVLDVWPVNSGGLEREQLVTYVGEFGSESQQPSSSSSPSSSCDAKVIANHKYIFFMDPTDEPLVFKASFAPLDTSGKNLKKDVGKILCVDCAAAPRLKPMKYKPLVDAGEKLTLKCEATGNPMPSYKWYKDGKELTKKPPPGIKIKGSLKNSRLQISRAKLEHSGNYTCVVENSLGRENATRYVNVQSIITTTPSPGSGHARRCNDTEKAYCVNGGDCYFIQGINQLSCKCPDGYFGPRCLQTEPLRLLSPNPFKKAEELYQKRVLTITGICVALLVVGIVCVVAYCKTKKQRRMMHNHLRQNMCPEHPNRNLANGPNHPGPGPEELPMVDYISKNLPATERVLRPAPEGSFRGSHASSRSHNSSTRAHSSTNRHDERTWSLDHSGSILSDSPGMMSSSVGTSKCSSPACMEARARRAAHCVFSDPHRPGLQYGESFDSLGDSPHSDRYVSALTTPARLSPVDLHYSLPPPTFQITSPNAGHAMSLPPAARNPYPPVEEDQPLLLRRYQVPLHDAQAQDPYRQQRRRSYLRDSRGSLPSSPYPPSQDEHYETPQEYLCSLEQPKRSASRGSRGGGGASGRGGGASGRGGGAQPGAQQCRRSRLNGHVAPRGYEASRDYGSRSCLTDSESEEGEGGESTPFLSMQNMNAEPPPQPPPPAAATAAAAAAAAYRPADSRTSQPGGRHSHTRLTHTRSKPDSNTPH
ncbi:neuregulin 2a isoform X2 [Gadus morhua]|uniref:neuregulin 2a isoform X2 n=1 Tax=Gadus morhua TaxID=8049 RepID=UPI0011B6ACCB|nr:pro-neuregulin-2, membrane-bound isoform isoform X2 [Gadus morhua]